MQGSWLRKQSGQAVVLVAVAALAGAELLMSVPPNDANIHNQGIGNLVKNIPGTTLGGTVCSSSCPNQPTIGIPGGSGIGSINLGAGYFAELSIATSYAYQVSVWHTHPVAIAPLHGFQSTITLVARATAQ